MDRVNFIWRFCLILANLYWAFTNAPVPCPRAFWIAFALGIGLSYRVDFKKWRAKRKGRKS